jgi:deoxyribodipyrimidine photo-lyase
MRELAHTGWMSNRGRQNVASLLAKSLQLDWTAGAGCHAGCQAGPAALKLVLRALAPSHRPPRRAAAAAAAAAAAGADLFGCLLLDCEPAVNWANWAYFAGVGNDPRNRVFKTVTQAGVSP